MSNHFFSRLLRNRVFIEGEVDTIAHQQTNCLHTCFSILVPTVWYSWWMPGCSWMQLWFFGQKFSAAKFPLYLLPPYNPGESDTFSQQHLVQQVECIDSYRFHCFYSVFLFLFLNHNSKSRVATSDGVCFTLGLLTAKVPQQSWSHFLIAWNVPIV